MRGDVVLLLEHDHVAPFPGLGQRAGDRETDNAAADDAELVECPQGVPAPWRWVRWIELS
jgi:hypothetical protein